MCGEATSVEDNSDDIQNWTLQLQKQLDDYDADDIFNADVTGLFFRLLPDKTLESKNPRCFKNVRTLPTNYLANKKAWMMSDIFKDWLTKLHNKFHRQKRRVAMVVDNCPGHPKMKNLKATTLVFLPPNTTSKTINVVWTMDLMFLFVIFGPLRSSFPR